jgi:beta-glucosidase
MLLSHAALAACVVPPGLQAAEIIPTQLPDPNWQARVDALDATMARTDLTKVQTLFLGDSITEAWPDEIFHHFYGTRAAFNLGVRGDSTQGMLWRLNRLPLGTTLRPKLIVLLLGTNNLFPRVNISNVVAGMAAVLDELRVKLPNTRILVLDVLPRGVAPSDPFREMVGTLNQALSACAAPGIQIVNPGPILLDGRGFLPANVSYDGLHPSWLGYAMLGAALEPTMKQIIGD